MTRSVNRVEYVDLGLLNGVKLVCSSVTVKIFWHHWSYYNLFQADLTDNLAHSSSHTWLSMSLGKQSNL